MSLSTTKEVRKQQLKQKLIQLSENQDEDQTKEEAIDAFLDELFDVMEAWIKSSKIEVIVTTLVATSPAGPVTGTGKGKATIL